MSNVWAFEVDVARDLTDEQREAVADALCDAVEALYPGGWTVISHRKENPR